MSRCARYQTVCWDFDGTLAASAEDVWVSLEWAAHVMGWQIPEKIRAHTAYLALEAEELYTCCNGQKNVQVAREYARLVRMHYRKLNRFDHTVLYPGIQQLLETLKLCGANQWIVTNKPQPALERVLLCKGWSHYFLGWICPDGATIHLNASSKTPLTKGDMLKALHLDSTASNAVMIGDSAGDIYAGHSVGIDTIGALYGEGSAHAVCEAHPTLTVSFPTELEQLLLSGTSKGTHR